MTDNKNNEDIQVHLDRLGITKEQYEELKAVDESALKVMQDLPEIDPRIVIPDNPKVHVNSLKNLMPYQPLERQLEIREKAGKNSTLKPLVSSRKRNQQELVNLLRKLKPHLSSSVQTAVKMLHGDAPDSIKLQAAKMVLGEYRGLLKDLQAVSDDDEQVEQVVQPRFSLTVVEDAVVNEPSTGGA